MPDEHASGVPVEMVLTSAGSPLRWEYGGADRPESSLFMPSQVPGERLGRLPKEGLLLGDEVVSIPEGRSPGAEFAKLFVGVAGQRDFRP